MRSEENSVSLFYWIRSLFCCPRRRFVSKYWLQWQQGNFYSQHIFFLQATSDSVIGQGLAGGGAQPAALLEDREENSATLCKEVTKLTTALQEYQDMMQVGCWHKKKTKKKKQKFLMYSDLWIFLSLCYLLLFYFKWGLKMRFRATILVGLSVSPLTKNK